MGQVLSATQTIGAQNYPMSQTYDLAGHVKQMTYPSNRTVNYSYDATGRLNSFTGNLGDSTTRNYATAISYASNGAWKREQSGTTTALYNKRFYNNRQQLYGMFLSTVNDDGNWNRGAIVNYYSLSNYREAVTQTSPGLPRCAATLGPIAERLNPQRGCVRT
jgi:YD repeat-containing protein